MMALHQARGGRIVTTNYVFAELLPLCTSRARQSRSEVLERIESLQQLPRLEIIHVDESLHQRAFALLKNRPDKAWSWADAVSFVVMEERQLTDALTTDHHFEQAGFRALLA